MKCLQTPPVDFLAHVIWRF